MSQPNRDEDQPSPSVGFFSEPGQNNSNDRTQHRGSPGFQNLEQDLLPSPPSTSQGSRSSASNRTSASIYSNADQSATVYRFPRQDPDRPSSIKPKHRTVTVRDLRNKSCWICSEEEEASAVSSMTGDRHRFVHPCNCTLVAHESCLLQWVEQSRTNNPLQDTVTCPQCKAPYILVENKPLVLRLLEVGDKLLTRIVPVGIVSVLGGTLLIASTAYGCVAIRMVLGREASKRALASPWPWHYWLEIPLIPFALITSKLPFFESALTWAPSLVVMPITSLSLPSTQWALVNRYMEERIRSSRTYPPGPVITALVVPWLRIFYLALKRKVYRAVLSPLARRSNGDASMQPSVAETGNGRPRRTRRVIIIGEGDGDGTELLDADPPGGGVGAGQGAPGAPFGRNLNQNGGNDGPAQTIRISGQTFGRMCLSALSLPFIANVMGKLLARLAQHSRFLARILGMEKFIALKKTGSSSSILSSFYTTNSTPSSTTSAQDATLSPLASLFKGQLPGYDDRDEKRRPSFRDSLSLVLPGQYDDLDPVWFRNAIGAGLFIVFKDAGALLYKYLKLRQKNRTRITDLPFPASLVEGLDLRE